MVLTGRVPLLLILGLVPLLLRPAATTAWLWLLAVLVLVAWDWWRAASPEGLELSRAPIPPVRQGHPTTTVLTCHHPGPRRLRGVLRDAWQPTAGATDNRHPVDLRPGESQQFTTGLRPVRRGDLGAAAVTVRAYGPWGLAARQRTLPAPGVLRSVPPFESRKHLPSRLARLRELDGRSAVRVRGSGTEFDSLREYVRGDDVRSIDWRVTARNRSVVVRTWQPERDRRVIILLDTSRTSAGRIDDLPRLDTAMDAALLLAALAARAGDRVDLVAGDHRVRARVRTAATRDVAARLQDVLAGLQPILVEADWRRLTGAVLGLGRQRALLVVLTSLHSSALEEGLLPVLSVLTRHHRVVLAAVNDPALGRLAGSRDAAEEVYDAAAAEQALAERRRTSALLDALEVHVIDADPERLAPVLADHYLALKSQGLL